MPANYYPPIRLMDAIKLGRAIEEKNQGHAMYRPTLAEELNLKAEGRMFRDLITSSGRYGITKGGYKATEIELTETGRRMLSGDSTVILDALFQNKFFASLHEKYIDGIVPTQKNILDFIKSLGVAEKNCQNVVDTILCDMRDHFLIQTIGGNERFVGRDKALEKLGSENLSEDPFANSETSTVDVTEKSESSSIGLRGATVGHVRVSPNVHLNFEIHIAADTPHETIEKIFSAMGTHLLNNE